MTNWQKQENKWEKELAILLQTISAEYDEWKYAMYLYSPIKQFISAILEVQEEEDMLRCKQAKILTAEATRDFIVGQIEDLIEKEAGFYEDVNGEEVTAIELVKLRELKAKLKTLTK